MKNVADGIGNLLVAISSLVFRYGSTKFPSVKVGDDGTP
jgi:hypothetical protein